MVHVTYEVVRKDDGYAYKVGDVYSETFPTHDAARAAAEDAARRQRIAGSDTPVSWEDANGKWHEENVRGGDRPQTDIVDRTPDGK